MTCYIPSPALCAVQPGSLHDEPFHVEPTNCFQIVSPAAPPSARNCICYASPRPASLEPDPAHTTPLQHKLARHVPHGAFRAGSMPHPFCACVRRASSVAFGGGCARALRCADQGPQPPAPTLDRGPLLGRCVEAPVPTWADGLSMLAIPSSTSKHTPHGRHAGTSRRRTCSLIA